MCSAPKPDCSSSRCACARRSICRRASTRRRCWCASTAAVRWDSQRRTSWWSDLASSSRADPSLTLGMTWGSPPHPGGAVVLLPRRLGRLVLAHQLLADGAEDALVGGGGEIDQVLAILVAVEGDDEAVDAEGDDAAQVAVLAGEVVLAEVRDGVEQLAVAHVEVAVGAEDLRRGFLVRGGEDEAVDDVAVD